MVSVPEEPAATLMLLAKVPAATFNLRVAGELPVLSPRLMVPLPAALALSMDNRPALIVSPPLKVLAPVSTSVPAPVLVIPYPLLPSPIMPPRVRVEAATLIWCVPVVPFVESVIAPVP